MSATPQDEVSTSISATPQVEGASVDDEELGKTKTGDFKMLIKKDLQYLVGNIEKLPDSARKLFNEAKLYLMAESSDSSTKEGFVSLSTHVNTVLGSSQTDSKNPSSKESLFTPLKKSAPLYYAQTYIQWKSAQDLRDLYGICLPKRKTIYLQPIDEFPDFINTFRLKTHHLNLNFFETLQGFCQIFFSGFEVLVRPPLSLEGGGWSVRSRYHESTKTKQYCVNDFYPLLQKALPADGFCIAGIIWTDIFPEDYNFVLGEASVKHQAAVVSFGRFEPLGFDSDSHSDVNTIDGIVMWKLFKSLSHELCHLFGLEHCTFFLCAMNESSSVSDAMSHPLFLCPVCLRKLQHVCGFDVLERYQQLKQFLSTVVSQLEHTSQLEEALAWLDLCVGYLNS
ncbi:unnamed protein product [Candidula unifasciata]|uniref:Archaemetzincin-2 n=1 Tax=Candidula unifasciata TaxID=100452 RepID=A0A8S3YLC7_9EUPU|nr:unnamed protein product [Candidula unifasciata]